MSPVSTQIPKLGNPARARRRARAAGLLPPKEGMILLQLFCSVGVTAGYQKNPRAGARARAGA